jgi:hypothetical protein
MDGSGTSSPEAASQIEIRASEREGFPVLAIAQIVTLMLVALAMATSVAHALELPGKLRLPRDTYLAVQSIYYPGFLIGGGFGEVAGILGTVTLLFLTPSRSIAFWLTAAACILMVLMHLIFWVFTQPVNRFWLRHQRMAPAGAAFFEVHASEDSDARKWTSLRDQWEYSHLTRAILSFIAVALIAAAIAAS